MQRRRGTALALGLALATGVFVSGPAAAAGDGGGSKKATDGETTMTEVADQRGDHAAARGRTSSLPASRSNVRVVDKVRVTDIPNRVADVAYLKGFAYLARWQAGLSPPDCSGGAWVVDMRDPKNAKLQPKFLKSHPGTYATEGMQALHIETAAFTGDILLISNEICDDSTGIGGLTIWDVTNPRRATLLSEGVGDTTIGHFQDPNAIIGPAHEYHSAFAWRDSGGAFAIAVDNNESGQYDVDIFDLTDPSNPVLIQETGRPDWPNLNVDAFGTNAFLHDLVAKKVSGTPVGALSYWDGGWVNLDLSNPAAPVFLGDSDYLACEPFFPAICPPEGNAHYGEWNWKESLFIGNDEDFSPYRLDHQILNGPHAGEYPAGEFGWTVPLVTLPDNSMNGPTVFGGYGCPDDRDQIPTADEILDQIGPLDTNEELILVLQRGPVSDPNEGDDTACFFSEKVETAQLLGYDGAIVANHHSGSGAGASPDAFICGSQGHDFDVQIPGACVGHREMHLLFDDPDNPDQTYPPDYTVPYPLGDPGDVEPDIGDIGWDVAFTATFDGWGYNHLFENDPLAGTWNELDQYAIPEALDEDFAQGSGTLSVHEVATDPKKGNRNLAYYAYYDGGFRVTKYNRNNGFTEVGHFTNASGPDLWGVQLAGLDSKGRRLIAASHRDFGLYIFRYTGP